MFLYIFLYIWLRVYVHFPILRVGCEYFGKKCASVVEFCTIYSRFCTVHLLVFPPSPAVFFLKLQHRLQLISTAIIINYEIFFPILCLQFKDVSFILRLNHFNL